MQDRRYLLSISELLVSGTRKVLWEQCFSWLDGERKSRLQSLKSEEKQAESIGAGLLLQLAVMEAVTAKHSEANLICLTVSEVLHCLKQLGQKSLPLEYTYGKSGKPYLKNHPWYFNLSHSGQYIFCVISEQEVGVDIQWRKPITGDSIARRFFSEEEQKALEACHFPDERDELFYRLWVKKEAYGKLTGKGIAAVIDTNVYIEDEENCTCADIYEKVSLEEYTIEDYRIAVCKWK